VTELPPAVAKYVADASEFERGTDKAVEQAKKFTRDAEKSALAARRVGIEAKEAGEKAARAGKIAAEAAQKAARGFLTEEKAAEAAARAVRELERAELKQIAAAIATREAAEKAAKAHQANGTMVASLARDSESAAGRIGDAFTSAGKTSSGAMGMLGKVGPANVAMVAGAIAGLPVIATVAATGITLGLGGALIGLGMLASKGSKTAQREIEDLKKFAQAEARYIGEPFEQVWVSVSRSMKRELREVSPELRGILADLSPDVQKFADQAVDSLSRLLPAAQSGQRAMSALMGSLGPRLPEIMSTLSRAIEEVTSAVEENPEEITAMISGLADLVEMAGKVIGALTQVAAWVSRNSELVGGFLDAVPGAQLFGDAVRGMGTEMTHAEAASIALNGAVDAVRKAASSANLAARSQKSAQQELNEAMRDGKTTADQLKAALDRLTGAHQSADEAEISFRNAIASATSAVNEHGRGLDLNTQKGRDNRQALIDVARAAQEHLVAMRADNVGMAEVSAAAATSRARFISLAQSMGASKKEAIELANRLLGIKSRSVTVTTTFITKGAQPVGTGGVLNSQVYIKRAAGGPVVGPGGPRDDKVLLWGSNGEYMINAASAEKYRPLVEAINADRLADGGLVGRTHYASGGEVKIGGTMVSSAQLRRLAEDMGREFRRAAKLADMADRRTVVKAAIEDARQYATGLTSNARSFAGLSALEGPTNASQVRQGLNMKLSSLTRFTSVIKKLSARGLSKSIQRQVMDMGPEQGLAYGEMLLAADSSTFKQINSVQAGIDKAASSLGTTGADALYDAGKGAGAGFLAGLKKELAGLDKTMASLAKSMSKSIKKALKIKSPSQLPEIRESGAMTVAGITAGMEDALPRLDAASQRIAARLTRPGARGPRMAPALIGAAHRSTAATGSSSGQPVIEVRVFIGGQEVRALVQSETLRYGRRNSNSGLDRRTS
jgi:hypothetical protein